MEQTRKQTDIAFTVSGRLAASCAVAYMALPTILFLLGWVRPLFSVPAAAAVAAAAVLLGATIPAPTLHFTRRQMAIYLCVLALSLLWLLAGGMTGITSQHADFVVRNPIYETLIRCDWPLVDAGGRPFIYYLAFWLPPALACKCLSCSDIFIINYVLTAWTGLGLALTLTVLWSRFRTATLLFLLLLIFQGPLDGIVRWGLHLFHLQGPLAHELYLTVLAFFGGVPPTMQLHNTFHHTTLLWLFLAMAAAWDIPPKYQLFLASLCLLSSPIGSLGLLVFIAVRTLIRRTPVRQYFSSWTVLAGAALVLLAGIYFTSSNGNNRIRLTWQDSPFDLLQYGNWKFWAAMAGSWLLTVGVPAALLFRRFKKDALFWSALAILTLTYFIYIGSVGGYNEFCYKASSVSFFCLAPPLHPHLLGTDGAAPVAPAVRLLPDPGRAPQPLRLRQGRTHARLDEARAAGQHAAGMEGASPPSGTSLERPALGNRRRTRLPEHLFPKGGPVRGRAAGPLFHRNKNRRGTSRRTPAITPLSPLTSNPSHGSFPLPGTLLPQPPPQTVLLVHRQPDSLPALGHQRHESPPESAAPPVRGKHTACLPRLPQQ